MNELAEELGGKDGNVDLIERAKTFAIAAHKAIGQRRKYTGECYSAHPEEVAALVEEHGGTEAMIAAAWLHDVVEDTRITIEDIDEMFGDEVAELVYWLTDISRPEDGKREIRKAIDREHLAAAPAKAQTIKYCDFIRNTPSIVENDPKFAVIYLAEKRACLEVMDKGDPVLRELAMAQVDPDQLQRPKENGTSSAPNRSLA